MGLKKMFMKKDPTEQELREELNRVGITTKSNNQRQEKFGAFKTYAQERAQMKPGMAPVNPYANVQNNDPAQNPYANNNINNNGGDSQNDQFKNDSYQKSSSPYSSSNNSSNPYNKSNSSSSRTLASDPYSMPTRRDQPQQRSSQRPPRQQPPNSQSQNNIRSNQPVSRISTRQTMGDTESSLDLNAISSHQMFKSNKPIRKQEFNEDEEDDSNLDLNDQFISEETDENLDLNLEIPGEEEQVNSEDEEVEAIKQDIRFIKQESVQSTRNTLRMAQEADASGTNTLGMLGSQSERLFNAEQNLLLADTQTQIADEKVKELRRLNRSIFIPAYGNPFNKKSRLRQQEENIKNRKIQEKYLRETNRQGMYESEQRLKQGLMNNATNNDIHKKYSDEKNLNQASRYQFENDSEDDETEKEIASNLNEISNYTKKLHGIANTMGKEVDSQNIRLRKIEEDADKLDINVHMNSTRLSNIR
ncbi:SEC9 [Candida pseudojiufengensis]|uniref:SEC9 n=1 Tax=Candida pseudojiufengensis TaxID=497109 RepID=UPI0022257F34|nr:SEC9 [Candida pseudojiufengensis]KAI5962928.1 SEC9 [Candida pseudojiufengensis]